VLIGEIYLPIERLVTYYGKDLGGAQLPFNFQFIHTAWTANEIASLVTEYEGALPAGLERRSVDEVPALADRRGRLGWARRHHHSRAPPANARRHRAGGSRGRCAPGHHTADHRERGPLHGRHDAREAARPHR